MDYKIYSVDMLCRKRDLETSLGILEDEIGEFEALLGSVKTANAERAPSRTNQNHEEERILNIIVTLDECRRRRGEVRYTLNKMNRALKHLDRYENDLLSAFYIARDGGCEAIKEKYHKEKSVIYRDRNNAVTHFTRCCFGIVES